MRVDGLIGSRTEAKVPERLLQESTLLTALESEMARNADENDVVSVDTLLAELLPQAEGMRASVCYAKGDNDCAPFSGRPGQHATGDSGPDS